MSLRDEIRETLTTDVLERCATAGGHYSDNLMAALEPVIAKAEQPLARLWANWQAECELDDHIFGIFGFCDEWLTNDAAWPFTDIVYDEYDNSFELRGIKSPDWLPMADQWTAMWAFGFGHCWLCYADGHERYCNAKAVGERVTKPHCHEPQEKHRTARERKRAEAAEDRGRALQQQIDTALEHLGFIAVNYPTGPVHHIATETAALLRPLAPPEGDRT